MDRAPPHAATLIQVTPPYQLLLKEDEVHMLHIICPMLHSVAILLLILTVNTFLGAVASLLGTDQCG